MKKRTVVLVALAVALGGLAAIGAGIAALLYVAAEGISSREPTPEETKLVLTSKRLSERLRVDARCERLRTKRGIDGSREVEAEYDSESCPGVRDPLSFISNAEVAKTKRDARQSYRLAIGAYKVAARIAGVTVHDAPALLVHGDEHYAAELRQDANPVGNVFVVRQGRIVQSVFLVGLHIDNPDDARALLAPLLEEGARR